MKRVLYGIVLMYALNASAGGIADAYLGSQPEFNYLDEQEQRYRARKIVTEEDRRLAKLPSHQLLRMQLIQAEQDYLQAENDHHMHEQEYRMQQQMEELQQQIDDLRR